MKFAYTILYVKDVEASLKFYEMAFGFERKMLHESGMYGELNTGDTTLAFAAEAMGELNFPSIGIEPCDPDKRPNPSEIAFTTDDVTAAFEKAVANGATAFSEPVAKPWGQTVAYVRDPDGHLIELCKPIA